MLEIIDANHELRSDLGGPTASITRDRVETFVRRSYWQWYWLVESMNALRIELGDFPEQGDWYVPFKHAVCVASEATYRREIELPPAFDEDVAREALLAYPLFMDIVLAGDEDPLKEWREYHENSDIPRPNWD